MAEHHKVTFKNTSVGPRGFHAISGFVSLERGQSWTGDISAAELASAKSTGYFNGDEAAVDHKGFSSDDIASAVALLDHGNDDHWTKGGLPSVEAVGEALGGAVTRADITDAAPGAKRNG